METDRESGANWPQILGPLAVLVFIAICLVARYHSIQPKMLTGTLFSLEFTIGGEGTGTVLRTPDGEYDLDLTANPEWRLQRSDLSGRVVTVRGRLVLRHWVETGKRRTILVDSLEINP